MTSQQRDLLRALKYFATTLQSIEKIQSESDVNNILKCLQKAKDHLPGPLTVQKLSKFDDYVMNAEIIEAYSRLLTVIIRDLLPQWPVFKDKIVSLFTIEDCFAVSYETVSILCGYLKNETNQSVQEALSYFLLKYIKSDAVIAAAIDCSSNLDIEEYDKYQLQHEWENYVQMLVTLPERVANKLQTDTPKDFSRSFYSTFLIFHIVRCLDFMSECNLNLGSQYDMYYLSYFLSKVITNYNINGNCEAVYDFTDVLISWVSDTNVEKTRFVKRKLIQTLMKHMSRPAIENFAYVLLAKCPIDYKKDQQIILHILGDNFDTNNDWKEILIHKIPFYFMPRDYKNTSIPENFLYYLSTTRNSVDVFTDLFDRLSRAWADVKLNNTSNVDQHMYLSELLVLSVKYRTLMTLQKKIGWNFMESKSILFKGMGKHLDVWSQEYRCVGMATIEVILKTLADIDRSDREASQSLNFKYAEMGESCVEIHRVLKELTNRCLIDKKRQIPHGTTKILGVKRALDSIAMKIIDREDMPSTTNTIVTCAVKGPEQTKEIVKAIISVKLDALEKEGKQVVEDLDSDDDLEPYDMSNDVSANAKFRPTFLRELLDNLVEAENIDTFEACLSVAEEMVTKQMKAESPRLATQLLDIFIHLEPKFHVDDFERIKFNTCVAIVYAKPAPCAEHLCKEFHTDVGRYSIATKIYMLDILSAAVNKISNIMPEEVVSKATSEIISTQNDEEKLPPEEIIRRRLINKTKYYHSKRPHPFAKAKINEFSKVADSFFYPLIGGLGYKQLTLSHHNMKQDIDNILLFKYLAVVGNVILASKNCPKCSKYCWEILQMLLYLRYTPDPKLKSCVISLLASVILALPPYILKTEFFDTLMEFRSWLVDCLSNFDLTMQTSGAKSELAVFAGQVLGLIEKSLSDFD
ncbi:telomere length regulation protein TEL2 homolog [Manduca sexta]|uniref:Telomere length regulation protein conserved domain-containing protein n=1 Tax=Manduca sexta TaxID=7130 RepID=A0A922CT16_MANSE|nr:telomere length regulation protein TEL2 homolog [Manduca sexta]KAG6456813.1 hypothetical protein O3G_MSEX009953 [Manduca sexta]